MSKPKTPKTNTNDIKQKAIETLKRREQASKSFLAFIQYVHPGYELKPFHKIIIEQCEKWVTTPNSKLIISMPPRHGKSEIVSRYLPAYVFGRYMSDEVMLVSYGADLAAGMSRDTQRIMESELYKQIFPKTQLGQGYKKTEREFEIVKDEAGRGGKYHSAGFDGVMTGKGFKFGIVDDAHKNSTEANSTTTQETLWEKYQAEFLTRRASGARVLVMGTRWNQKDIIGRILEGPDADEWVVLTFPFICEKEDAPFEYRKKGEVLWPERYPESIVSGFDYYTRAALYQQSPEIRTGGVIQEEFFPYVNVLPNFISMVLYWDVGGSDSPTADSTVGTLLGRTPEGRAVVIYQEGFRYGPKKRNDRMVQLSKELCEQFPATKVWVEGGVGLGVQSTTEIRDAMLRQNIPVRIDRPKTSKYERFSAQKDAFRAAMEAMFISMYTGMNQSNWIKEFFDECRLLRYVQTAHGEDITGPHDDKLDSLVSAYNRCSAPIFEIRFLEDIAREKKSKDKNKMWDFWNDPTFH